MYAGLKPTADWREEGENEGVSECQSAVESRLTSQVHKESWLAQSFGLMDSNNM